MNYKTSEEIRLEQGMSQNDFALANEMSRRTYLGRLDGSQPKWLLDEVIKLASHNGGAIRVSSYGKTYDIKVNEVQ